MVILKNYSSDSDDDLVQHVKAKLGPSQDKLNASPRKISGASSAKYVQAEGEMSPKLPHTVNREGENLYESFSETSDIHDTNSETSRDEVGDEDAAFMPAIPNVGVLAAGQLPIYIVPVCLVAAAFIGTVFRAQLGAWWKVVHVALTLTAAIWLFVARLLRARHILEVMGDKAAKIIVCEDAEVMGQLSKDPSVLYVQQQIRGRTIRAQQEAEEAEKRATDPLYFIRSEINQWEKSEDGYTIIDPMGIILYVNPPMLRFFGYEKEDMINENVRALMPQPYSGQHDHFLKKHMTTGICNVLGKQRQVDRNPVTMPRVCVVVARGLPLHMPFLGVRKRMDGDSGWMEGAWSGMGGAWRERGMAMGLGSGKWEGEQGGMREERTGRHGAEAVHRHVQVEPPT